MKALNLYFLTRIQDPDCFSEYESALAGVRSPRAVKTHEQASLHALMKELEKQKLPLTAYDDFFLSFVISHISKEFDLLKIAADRSMVLNIELKSQEVSPARILHQLLQNRYYLRHLSGTIFSYTYVSSSGILYTLTEDENLRPADFAELCRDMRRFSTCVTEDIESLFRAEDYLISPSRTPEKFLSHGYFLTTQQNDFKAQIIEQIDRMPDGGFLCLTGSPGTGKTLLLYDLAMDRSAHCEVCIIHCGILQEVHRSLDQEMDHVRICSITDLSSEKDLAGYSLLLLDEAHAISAAQFELIRESVRACGQVCVFSFDSRQILYASAESRETILLLQSLSAGLYKLSDKIRANKELSSFILSLFQQKKRTVLYDYRCVQIVYAGSQADTQAFLSYFMDKGYIFVDYDRQFPLPEPAKDRRSDSIQIVGQEYDKVVVLMDDRFFYDESGRLSARPEADGQSPLPELLFQAVSRARDRLAILVTGSPILFERVNSIKLVR